MTKGQLAHMLEILFVYMLWNKMGEMMRRKGYENPLKFQLLVPLWWVSGEIAGFFVFMLTFAIVTGRKTLVFGWSTYFAGLIVALVGIMGMFVIARRFPDQQGH